MGATMTENNSTKGVSPPRVIELSKVGFQALGENDLALAEKNFRAMLEIEAENPYALVGLAECASKRSNPEQAVSWYRKGLEYHPDNEVCLRGLIMSLSSLSRHREVVETWEQHESKLAETVSMVLKAADAYRNLHVFDKAKNLYEQLLARQDNNRYALSGLAHLLYDGEQYRDSAKLWQRFLKLDENNVFALTSAGNCHRRVREFEAGLEYYEKAYKLDPSKFYVLFGLADCYRGSHLYQESFEYWKRILETDPQNRMILTRAGEASLRLGNEDAAEEYFKKALAVGEDMYALVGMARLEKSREQEDKAREYYRRASLLPGAVKRFGDELDTGT